jgi:hypothetical protein
MRSFYPPSSAALSNSLNAQAQAHGNGQGQPAGVEGYFSPMTKVYIGDVLDHLEMVVSSLDQFVATCDHLTDYVFVSARRGGAQRTALTAERAVVPDECVDGAAEHCFSHLPP